VSSLRPSNAALRLESEAVRLDPDSAARSGVMLSRRPLAAVLESLKPLPPDAPEPLLPVPAAQRRGLSIAQKLGLLIGFLCVAIVVPLTVYLVGRQLDVLRSNLERRADTYAQLMASQVRSAVAFDDRETAREAFAALASDRDLSGVVLFTEKGVELETWGNPSELARRAKSGVSERNVFDLADRVLAVVPVVSLEGPRGSLALELSKQNLLEDRGKVLQRSLLLGSGALVVGVALALFIAQSFARRLRAIDRVASLVAAGDLGQSAVKDEARDEIGSLSRSFGIMLEQIKRLIAEIARNAEQEQARLEGLVDQRTRALARRNDDMRRVLDNVDQGFLTIDRAGRMSAERSRILDRWLGAAPLSGLLVDYLERAAPGFGASFQFAWDQVLEDFLPLEASIEQMPRVLCVGERHFSIDYKPMGGEPIEGMLVVLTDMTAAIERARLEEEEREVVNLFTRLLEDRAGVLDFIAETNRLLDQVARETPGEIAVAKRHIHTLKGNAGLFGLDSFAKLCHAIEDEMQESRGNVTPADQQRLLEHWQRTTSKLGRFLDGSKSGTLMIAEGDYQAARKAVAEGASYAEIAAMLEAWSLEPVEQRLGRLAQQAESLAGRLGKLPVQISIEPNQLRVEPDKLADVWATLPHLVRNALDHGIESPEERLASGKTAAPRLTLRTSLTPREFVIEVSDTGRGIDWNAIRHSAKKLGLPSQTPLDLQRALFADGLSTRNEVTQESGRGVGTAAVARAVEAAGGHIDVFSERGEGTRFRLVFASSLARGSVPPAAG
jgi:two-component system, chemotaxis family, sensor kinase CheA